ncbi:hypothetical protein H2200_012685 [Cladophialophora chaetospira]|uniref:Uncharacterized protein n=1 Tax=Cladophialophora chaetospira TaxID=386627 RepID=A0AA38WXD7_9EURO|nr:hypothetical protein H2200_012685 [Cladophialophora chaetospira]
MANGWDKASAIGTWVAAFLAVVALVGVVGPILIWRATKTERHQALDAVDAGEAQNGEYITKGLRVTPSIRLFRKVQVPRLQRAPSLEGQKLEWNNQAVMVSQNSAGWVQFCKALQACKVSPLMGDTLVVRNGKMWLPIHKNWLLTLGIFGRFGSRPDEGKLPMPSKGKLKAAQALPGRGFGMNRKFSLYGRQFLNANWMSGREPSNKVRHIVDVDDYRFSAINGTFGCFWVLDHLSSNPTEPERMYYTGHKEEEIGTIDVDRLGIGALFWLSVGCLPSSWGAVYCLENGDEVAVEEEPDSSRSGVMSRRASITTLSPGVHFGRDDESGYDDEVSVHLPRRASQFVVPSGRKTYLDNRRQPDTIRVFRFNEINERVADLAGVADSLGAENSQTVVYSLDEVDVTDNDRSRLEETTGSTYMPAGSDWVRLGKQSTTLKLQQFTFLERTAAQILAQVLLDLPLAAEGYLINANKTSLCKGMLGNAAQSLPHLLGRVSNDLPSLNVPQASQNDILAKFEGFLDKCLNFRSSRAYFRDLHEMDTILASLLATDERVNAAIGVVTLTNNEFRDIMSQTVRLIPESKDATIELTLGTPATLNVPTVMGAVQRFVVDLGALFPSTPVGAGTVSIKYAHVVFAVLKACLRSAMIETSLDSSPLFTAFLQMNDVVYMG